MTNLFHSIRAPGTQNIRLAPPPTSASEKRSLNLSGLCFSGAPDNSRDFDSSFPAKPRRRSCSRPPRAETRQVGILHARQGGRKVVDSTGRSAWRQVEAACTIKLSVLSSPRQIKIVDGTAEWAFLCVGQPSRSPLQVPPCRRCSEDALPCYSCKMQ